MWLYHRGNRSIVYNTDNYDAIRMREDSHDIALEKSGMVPVYLEFEDKEQAATAFRHLAEAIKTGARLVHL